MNQKMLDEKFDREQTSSNIIQNDFFLLFYFLLNIESSQMHPTFHPTSKIFDVGCICAGLKVTLFLFLLFIFLLFYFFVL